MIARSIPFLATAALLAFAPVTAAQVRIVGAITGTVVDTAGLAVPGARVQLKDELTGIQKETDTNNDGSFVFPDLNFGSYEVAVSLQGFQTSRVTQVVVESSRTTDLRVTMQPGGLDEVVEVTGATPVLETTSNTISGTLNNTQLRELPLGGDGRNVFQLARLVPGVAQPAGTGSTHYNGMPGGTINPTIDGINNASNGFKSGGTSFFGTVPARLGAIEEVVVESAGLGADAGAQGGVNLKFITRRGTNRFRGSVFEQHRNESLNANTYFNNSRGIEKPKFRRHDYGGNLGGPLLPNTSFKDKVFFFVNFEQEYIPGTTLQTNTVLTAEAEQGIFRYQTASGEQRTANLLQIAAQNGFPAVKDPTIAAMLAKQQQAQSQGTTRSTNSLRTQSFDWLEPSKEIFDFPTARLDYQITPRLSWMGSYNLWSSRNDGRRQWPHPDVPVQYMFKRAYWIGSTALNWTMGPRTFNEFRYGTQHSGDTTPNRGVDFYDANGLVNGQRARFTLPFGLANMVQDAAPITGRHYITTIYDTMTMLRGNHTIKLGGTFRLTDWRDTSLDGAGTSGILGFPRYSLGSPAGDPVQSIFNTTSMPGIQNADLADVYALYGLLTGRLTRVQTGRVFDPATGEYSATTYRENWTSSKMGGVFVQDAWRMHQNFTLNYGLRWEFSGAPYSHTGAVHFPDDANLLGPSTALFQPGVLNGVAQPTLTRGSNPASTDYVNPAPNVGFAWTPNFQRGLLARIFGKGAESVIRGGYALVYYDEGTLMFSATAGDNPGQSQSFDLQPGFPGFTPGGLTLQSPLPPSVVFPRQYSDVFNQADFTFGNTSFATMKNDLRTPYVQSWNIGVQRELMKNTVIEARYLGNKASRVWRTYNLNEVNIFENGFLQEFKNAQQNLAINQAAGVASFQNRGLPGQVALPMFEAAFGARGSQAALPAASGFTNGGFITALQQGTAGSLANTLATSSTYICRMVGGTFSPCANLGYDAAGPYPSNVFVANPFAIGGANPLELVDDASYSNYHAMQLQLRRRYAGGLTASVNYTLAKNTGDIWADNATQTLNYRTLRDRSLDKGPTPFDVRHAIQVFGTYELPFGKERRVAIGNPVLDAIAGGWVLGGILTAQSGSPFRLSSGRATVTAGTGGGTPVNAGDSGVVLMNGLTVKDLQKMIKVSPGPGFARYWIDPKLIGPDGRANPEYLAPPTTPGEFGQFVYLYGPNIWNVDASLNKSVRLTNDVKLTLHITATNLLNHPVWALGGATGGVGLNFLQDANITSTTFGQSLQPQNNANARQLYARVELSF
jgi:Carboxypeptidase regulatory-like domain